MMCGVRPFSRWLMSDDLARCRLAPGIVHARALLVRDRRVDHADALVGLADLLSHVVADERRARLVAERPHDGALIFEDQLLAVGVHRGISSFHALARSSSRNSLRISGS